MKVIVDINNNNNAIKRVKESKIFDMGTISTDLATLIANQHIQIDENTVPILKVTNTIGDVEYYLVIDYANSNNAGDYVSDITTANLIKISTSSGQRPYKVYTAFLDQSTTGNPTATILENTLGYVPTWTRTSAGLYTSNIPVTAKVYRILNTNEDVMGESGAYVKTEWAEHSFARLIKRSYTALGVPTATDGLGSVKIEIRVYP